MVNKNLEDYMSSYSLYMLMSDLVYGKETKGKLINSDKKNEISLTAGEGTKRRKGIEFKRLKDKFYPDNCEGEKSDTNILNPIICNCVKELAEKRHYILQIQETLSKEDGYDNWRKKIKGEIVKWGFEKEEFTDIVQNIIFKLFMSPKYFFKKNPNSGDYRLMYCNRNIFELLNYNMGISETEKLDIKDAFVDLNETDETLEKYRNAFNNITKKSKTNQNDFLNLLYKYRMELNSDIQSGKVYVYENGKFVKKYIDSWNPLNEKKYYGTLEKHILTMKDEPIELLTSMIIFSICLPIIVLSDGEVCVNTRTEENKSKNINLLYKLFIEQNIQNNRTLIEAYLMDGQNDIGLSRLIEIVIDEIIDSYNYNATSVTKNRIRDYFQLCHKRDTNASVYASGNDLCYVNLFICNMDDDFLAANNLDRGKLLRTIFDYCLDKTPSKRKIYYAYALLKYAKYIFENKIIENYADLEDIFDVICELAGDQLAEYSLVKADILRTGIDEIKAFNQNPGEAYELYIKVFAATNQESMVDDCIIPCLHEWAEWVKKNEKDDTLMGKKLEEWEKIWGNVKVDRGDNKSIYEKFIEKCREDLKDKIEKIEALYNIKDVGIDLQTKNDSDLQTVSVPDNAEDIYIIIGAGKASRTFIHSVRDKEKCRVLLVPQEHEIGIIQSLKEWYKGSNVEVFTTGISTVLNSLDLYKIMSECENDKDVFEKYYASGVKKLHFMAIDEENKEGNLAAIVEVINQSWIRYYLYNLMAYSCTGVEFDFSEVDITIDSQAQTAWYLDSVMNRFGEDFYLKINHISSAELAVRELLTEYPLFLADVNDLRKHKGKIQETGHHNVVILGSNGVIVPTLIKSILQISGYMRDDKVTHEDLENAAQHYYKAFESAIGKDFSLTVIDEHAEGIEDIIVYDAPDLLREELDCVHTVPRFCNVNVHSSKFIRLLTQFKDNIKEEDAYKKKELEQAYEAIHNANYIIVATDDTEKSIDLAMKIRALRYRKDINDEPIISVYAPDSNQDEKINQFTIGKDVYEDAWHRSYHINMFGKCQEMYSEENLFNSIFDLISIELHLDDDFRKAQKKKRDYYKVVYNHRSCDSRAVAFIYVMYSVLGTKMIEDFTLSDAPMIASVSNRWSMRIFKDNLSQYLSKYNEIVESKDKGLQGWIDILAVLEHNRWNYMMMSEGYTAMPTSGQSDIDIKNKIKSWAARATDDEGVKDNDGRIEKTALKDNKFHMVKVHYAILPFDQLGDRVGLESIHYLNKEFSKINELVRGKKITDYLAKDELTRLKSSLKTEEEYRQILEKAEGFVTLEKTEFDKRMGDNNQKTVGIDKFERLMDEIGIEIKGFKTTKNRHYDREYVRDMARTMERILSNVRGKQKSNNMPVNTRDNVQSNGKQSISKSLETRI